MARIISFTLLSLLTFVPAFHAERPQEDGVERLLGRLQQAIRSGRPESYAPLTSAYSDRQLAEDFADAVIRADTTRVVVKERDRVPLKGTLPGEGFQLTVEAFVEAGREARLFTWALDVRRVAGEADAPNQAQWIIAAQRVLGTLPSIHRLLLDESRQFKGRQLVFTDEDIRITIPEADVYVADAAGAPTALVVLGRGQLRFAPRQPAERGQVKVFSGGEAVETGLDALFVRLPPGDFARHVSGTLEPRPIDARQFPRAAEVFREESARSYGLELGDLTDQAWSMLPQAGDFLAEIRTGRFGTLTYVRSSRDAEDVALFHRARRRQIAAYASADHLAARGRFYSEDDQADYKVASYEIDASFEPGRRWLEGRTRLRLQVTHDALTSLTLRLADTLTVGSVTSPEYGRLLAVRSRGQNSIVVSLPAAAAKGTQVTLDVAYAGVSPPQSVGMEAVRQVPVTREVPRAIRLEESFLYSNESYWYAQAPGNGFATATMRVRVPQDYTCVASGQLTTSPPAGTKTPEDKRWFTFVASRPARYFACLISRLVPAGSRVLTLGKATHGGRPDGGRLTPSLTLEVKANPRLRGFAKPLADTASDILEFYGSLVGDAPYADATIAAVEWRTPGGHSPAYMAVLNQPPPGSSETTYRDDPAFFDGFPEYYLAHELAHQWWGQAVGWKNYHEQWLSEGLAQYFAALYAGHSGGQSAFDAVIRSCRDWSMKTVGAGPIYLGYRVGHIKGDGRLFRAVVYDKSAAVLDMLRRLVGDDAFYRGLRRYYSTWRFRKAGSDDLRQAMQQESGVGLERFFERWIYGDGVPAVTYTTTLDDGPQGRELVVRLDQSGAVYDLPVTLTVQYADRQQADVLAKLTEQRSEVRIPLAGTFKRLEVNRDGAALGTFSEARQKKS